MRWCPKCEGMSPDTAEFCAHCDFRIVLFLTPKKKKGSELKPAEQLERDLRPLANTCPYCGVKCRGATCRQHEEVAESEAMLLRGPMPL